MSERLKTLGLALGCWLWASVALAAPIATYPPATTPLTGSEAMVATQSGNTVQVTAASIAALSVPGGSTGQLQYNNGGVFGGFTLAGDCTLSQPNIICLKVNGVNFGSLATLSSVNNSNWSGTVLSPANGGTGIANSGNLTWTGALTIANTGGITVTTPSTSFTAARTDAAQTFTGAQTFSTPIVVPSGGTGQSSLLAHGTLVGEGTGNVNSVAPGTAGFVWTSNGSGADPSFQATGGGVSFTGSVTVGDCTQVATSSSISDAGAPCGGTGGPPTGAASGDLGGTYPSPNVVSVAHITTGMLAVAHGGTNATSASGTALDNITGFSSIGILNRTGAGAYSFIAIPLPIADGGTNATSASGTALDNITGFSSIGFLTRTGTGAYAFQPTTNGITLGNIAQSAANTILGNATNSTANLTVLSMPNCAGANNALIYTPGTGLGCNTISSGTVTNIATGTGLTGGPCTTTCTISASIGTTSGTVAAGNDSRFSGVTQNIHTSNYTFVLGDAGSQIADLGACATTFTIPANASVAYPVGTKIEIVNGCGGNVSLAITSDTLDWLPGVVTGTRTLANGTIATLTKITATIWFLVGVGISRNDLQPVNDNIQHLEHLYG